MVVDAGSGGVGVLDQIMYDEAYTKALSDGIDLLGGYGSRDNLAALEMAPMPATAGENTARLDGNMGPLDLGMPLIDGFAVRDLGAAPGMATGVAARPVAGVGDETPFSSADGETRPNAESDGPVASGDRDSTAIASRDPSSDAMRAPAASTELKAVGGMASARVTTPTTRVLGAYDAMSLASMPARELRRRFCDVFDAPPPTRRREDETWLRHALAPHAIDATPPGEGARGSVDERLSSRGLSTIRGFQTDAARYEGVGPTGFSFPVPGDVPGDATGHQDATDDDDDDGDASDDGRETLAFGKTPSPVDRRGSFASRRSFDSKTLVPESRLGNASRSPNASEVLARVARRTPVNTCGWAMATAAAARAIAEAGEKSALALSARAECERLAAEAGKAVRRARKAAANAARVRDGTEQAVPFAALPRAIAERVARTGAAGARPGRKRAAPQTKGGGKQPRRDSRSRSSSAGPRDTDSGLDANTASGEMHTPDLCDPSRDAEASISKPKGRMTINSLVRGDAAAAERVAAIWHAAVDADACHVCGAGASDRWGDDDEIVFCDGCDVQVHLSCYGLKRVPKGKWLCQGCEDKVHPGDAEKGEVGTCALCPQPGGALAVLDPPSHWDVAWETPGTHAHVSCASCLPEVFVWKDVPGRETKGAVIDMSFVKASRINLTCSLCAQEGACTQCAMRKCFATFHPLCARGAGFETERHASQDGRHLWFCRTHSGERWGEKRREAAGMGGGERKAEKRDKRSSKKKASKKRAEGEADTLSKAIVGTNGPNVEAAAVTANAAGPDASAIARGGDAEGAVQTEA